MAPFGRTVKVKFQRRFGGRIFQRQSTHSSKRAADAAAKSVRSSGGMARVVKHPDRRVTRYIVYARRR